MNDFFRKIILKARGGIWTLKAAKPARGFVLLSYTTLPFISPGSIGAHSNRWECRRIAEIWRDRDYDVDIVDYSNSSFKPKKDYDYCIDVECALERLSPYLKKSCVKIFHITAAHWKFQNEAELKRIAAIKKKRGAELRPRRIVSSSKNIELCDIATMLGNAFTAGTYAFAGKKIVPIPISTTHEFPSPQGKDFEKARKNYIWLGGAGMAHKGLDLVLEAFAKLPDYTLFVFGKKDVDFAEAYHKELYETSNIKYMGMVDLGSDTFKLAARQSIGVVFPSCSEGSSGGVVTSMHAGLIPLISYESGVNVDGFGVVFKKNTKEEIAREVLKLSSLTEMELRDRAVAAWKYAGTRHTRETFSKAYESFVDSLINDKITR